MRMVVDTNFLERPELRDYLAASQQNFAVLTEYAAMEACKTDTISSINRRMKVVCEFPTQVIVLRGTQEACGLTGTEAEFAESAIDYEQTVGFPEFCRAIALAQSGNRSIQRQLLQHGQAARVQLERMLTDSAQLAAGISDIAASFTPAELRIMRLPEATYPDTLLEKIAHRTMELAAILMRDHPAITNFPSASEARDRFLFRIALCAIILATRWISVGGAHLTKPDKLRNDQVDINFAAFATYYDGLFTDDRRLAKIYSEAKLWLDSIFSRDHSTA